jgi:transcriptional regulator with XRE-family HTH domain
VEPARPLQAVLSHSPLASVRLRRRLTIEEAAKRAGISADEASWLEEGRVYRFRSPDEALVACVLYASALEIDGREARELAGLPVPPKPLGVNPQARLVAVAAVAALMSALGVAVTFTHFHLGSNGAKVAAKPAAPKLPPVWKIQVDVLNGSGDINYTRQIASKIGALGYRIGRVAKASRFDYPRTKVYYEPGGLAVAVRLARALGVVTSPLPGGSNPRRLVMIVGPHRGPG